MFSNTTAELSLNAPSRCITSVQNDTQNHRFLVGTCSLPSASPSSSSYSESVKPLYLLRYHEDMNEMSVDAHLDFGNDNVDDDNDEYSANDASSLSAGTGYSGGEIWSVGSCPKDKRLLVACRGIRPQKMETALWRIPESALREDELQLDYYPDKDDYDFNDGGGNGNDGVLGRPGMSESYDATGGGATGDPMGQSLRKVCNLDLSPSNKITDMQWNPGTLPNRNHFDDDHHDSYNTYDVDANDNEYDESNVGGASSTYTQPDASSTITAADLLTVHADYNTPNPHMHMHLPQIILSTFDLSSSSIGEARKLQQISIPVLPSNSRNNRRISTPHPPKASWDPHNHHLCAVTLGNHIGIVDMRSESGIVNGLKNCHRYAVTDVDYNPNKPHVLTSSGQDSFVKFWDLRFTQSHSQSYSPYASQSTLQPNPNMDQEDLVHASKSAMTNWIRHTPVRTLRGGHTHWTTCVKYNSFHDQLLLSAGTDAMLNLWRISSISSAPLMDMDLDVADDHDYHSDEANDNGLNPSMNPHDGEGTDFDSASVNTDGGNAPDVRVTKMEMREAIYDVAWSAADPWLFVTLGYDGNVVSNHVPSKEKYKILL